MEEAKEIKEETVDACKNIADVAEIAKQPTMATETAEASINSTFPSSEDTDSSGDESASKQLAETIDVSAPVSEFNDDDKCQLIKTLIDAAVQQILAAFSGLQESFDGKIRFDAKKDGIIDRQFQELSQFKSGLVEKVTMQIINDLIGEIDSAQKLVRFYEETECNESNYRKLQKVLRDIPASLCDLLEKYGVTSFTSKVGAPFNPKRQKALKTTETGVASKDKTVRELLRLGFEQEIEAKDDQPSRMKILRSEMVDVFVYNPALADVSSSDDSQEHVLEADAPAGIPASKMEQ